MPAWQILKNIGKYSCIYKFVRCTINNAFFVPINYASCIVTNEMGSNNQSQNTIENIQIKAVCWKLNIDRLGEIIGIEGK